jgi:glucose-1-phosphate adenylyltransferase
MKMIVPSPMLPRAALSRTLTLMLATGHGSRLHELTSRICKPALPVFATPKGPLRLVDFVMANVVHSGMPRLIVATYEYPRTLEVHLARRWSPLFANAGLVLRNGDTPGGADGHRSSVDAVAANLDLIAEANPSELLVLPADHICQMDYSALIAAHRASGAMVTSAVCMGPTATVETGAHVFDWAWLRDQLPVAPWGLEFKSDILPAAHAADEAATYALPALPGQATPYWREVETLDSLRLSLLEFGGSPPCHVPVLPGAPFNLSGMALVAPPSSGCVTGVTNSVALPGAWIMPGARLDRVIVAPGTVVPADLTVGVDDDADARWFRRTPAGTTLITNAMLSRRAGQALVNLREPLLRAFELPSLSL